MLIPGATGNASHFTGSAEKLADEFTVITYDRRGNSRSRVTTDPDAVVHVSAQANDARAIISACGIDKVVVFGTSSGAIVALELVASHDDFVKRRHPS